MEQTLNPNPNLDRGHLLRCKNVIRKYMLEHCIPQEDWHGVADAANDLREIDSKLKVLELLAESKT